MERDFKGVWIPKEELEKGLSHITEWVLKTYSVDLQAKNPLQEDK
jgi:hypothetical protein